MYLVRLDSVNEYFATLCALLWSGGSECSPENRIEISLCGGWILISKCLHHFSIEIMSRIL